MVEPDNDFRYSELQKQADDAINASRTDPLNVFALISVANNMLALGHVEEAASFAYRATNIAPLDARVLAGASAIIANIQDYHTCALLSEKAVELAPENFDYRLHFAIILLSCREPKKAEEQLKILVGIRPNSAISWRNLSSAYAELGRFNAALESASKAIEYDPDNVEFRIHRSGLLNLLGRTADALADLRHAEILAPDNAFIFRMFSSVHLSFNDTDTALAYAKRAYAMSPSNQEFAAHQKHLEDNRDFAATALASYDDSRAILNADADRLALRLAQGRRRRSTSLIDGVVAQIRIISALLIRETRTRFGETRLGFAWAILEPVSHLALIAIVFSTSHIATAPVGDNILTYYFTGVVPYLLFTNTSASVTHAIVANESLLQIPAITFIDVLFARAIIELFTQILVSVVILSSFNLFGVRAIPFDIAQCAIAFSFLWLMATGIGFINAVIFHFVRSWDHIYANLTRVLYFTSGVFLHPIFMPVWLRDILIWNPLLQAIEWFRTGFFSAYNPPWLSPSYLIYWALTCIMLGMAMERALRRRISVKS